LSTWATEFDFVEDESGGGKFVSATNVTGQLHTLIGRGEVDQAAAIYEENGGAPARDLLEQAKLASSNTRRLMAAMFQKARDFANAAKVLELNNQAGDAALLFEQAGQFAEAAAAHRKAGDLGRAGSAAERAGQLDVALELYRQADRKEDLADCLARHERYVEAAAVYRSLRNARAEVEMLRSVPVADAQRVPSVKRLAQLLEHYGRAEQASGLILADFRASDAARRDPELQATALRLLQAQGKTAEAEKLKAALSKIGAAPAAPVPPRPVTGAGDGPAAPLPAASEAYHYLKAIPIFGELSLPDMRDLFRICQEVQHPAGARLIEQGAAAAGLWVIIAGNVEVLAGGKKVNALGAGAYVGEISLVRDAPTSATVVATGPVRALLVEKHHFEHYLYEHPNAAIAIYRLFAQNLADRVRALSAQ
jgi:CRP-like cAMP-binding protein